MITKTKGQIFLPIKIALAITMAVSSSLGATSFAPDHYVSYDIKAGPFNATLVTLTDQFINAVNFMVIRPIKLLNPAVKTHAGTTSTIQNQNLHYTAYQIATRSLPKIHKKVTISNQFGTFTLDSFAPSRLLVPTSKTEVTLSSDGISAIPVGDHYLCYDIKPQTLSPVQFGFLTDQFRNRAFDVVKASRICNPVHKVHGAVDYPILNDFDTNHLMCFDLKKIRVRRVVDLSDQFGDKRGLVLNDDELCLPSTKNPITNDQCEGALPDNQGVCSGLCPNVNDSCLPDPTTGFCACVSAPSSCSGSAGANGVCNGDCSDATKICVPNSTTQVCECHTICGSAATPECSGDCPVGSQCGLAAGGGSCICS